MLDNASGVGCVWEAATAIQSLIAAGKLPRPLRSFRILCMFECFGFSDFAYQRPETIKRLIADVNVDGIGVKDIESGINRQPLFMPNFPDAEVDPFCEAGPPSVWRAAELATASAPKPWCAS